MSSRWNARISDGNSSTTPLGAEGAAQPTFRAARTAGSDGAETSLTISKPTGVVQDDVMLAYLVLRNTQAITPPTGWAVVRTDDHPIPDRRFIIYWKRAGAAEPANYTWTWAASTLRIGAIVAYDNIVLTGEPFNGSSGATETSTSQDTTIEAPSISGTTAGSMLVGFFGRDNGGFGDVTTPPPGMTERVDFNQGTNQNPVWHIEVADQVFGAGGDTGTRTATVDAFISGNTFVNGGQMVTLTPVVAGGGATFFGVAEEVLDYSALRIVAEADKFGTLDVEFSTNGINWRKTDSFPLVRSTLDPLGETSRSELVPVRARFARVNYRNGSAAQGFFRLQTILVPEADQPLSRVPERFRVHNAITTVAAGALTDVLTLTGDDRDRTIEVVAYGAVPNQPTMNTAAQFPYTMQVSRAGQVVQRTVIRNNVDTWQHVRFETSGLEVKIAVMHNELTSQSFFAFLNVREP